MPGVEAAILDAAIGTLAADGPPHLACDPMAERAGMSRRRDRCWFATSRDMMRARCDHPAEA